MVDRSSLQLIGLVMVGLTAGVTLVAAMVVYRTISAGLLEPPAVAAIAPDAAPGLDGPLRPKLARAGGPSLVTIIVAFAPEPVATLTHHGSQARIR